MIFFTVFKAYITPEFLRTGSMAIALFGTTSPAALATTVGVLTEIPVMLALCWFANKTKGWFK